MYTLVCIFFPEFFWHVSVFTSETTTPREIVPGTRRLNTPRNFQYWSWSELTWWPAYHAFLVAFIACPSCFVCATWETKLWLVLRSKQSGKRVDCLVDLSWSIAACAIGVGGEEASAFSLEREVKRCMFTYRSVHSQLPTPLTTSRP